MVIIVVVLVADYLFISYGSTIPYALFPYLEAKIPVYERANSPQGEY